MPRVAHLTSVHPPFDIRIFQKECRSLARFGYEVVLIAPHDRDERVDGVSILGVPARPGRLSRVLHTSRDVFRRAVKADCDLYHIHDPELLPVGQRLRRRGRKVVFDMHENLPLQIRGKHWIPSGLRPAASVAARWTERLMFRGIRVVTALSEESFARHYHWVGDAVSLQNMPLHDELLPIDVTRQESFCAGYLGGITAARGSRVMLEASAILRSSGAEPELRLIGSFTPASHQQEIERQIGELGLENARLHEHMPSANAWRLIARCHVGFVLFQSLPNNVESTPNKLFEYMALGIPVIASDFPRFRRIVEETGCGLCVRPDDPGQVAMAIGWMRDHPAEAAAMGQAGRDAVMQKYRWDAEFPKLARLYEELIGAPLAVDAGHRGARPSNEPVAAVCPIRAA